MPIRVKRVIAILEFTPRAIEDLSDQSIREPEMCHYSIHSSVYDIHGHDGQPENPPMTWPLILLYMQVHGPRRSLEKSDMAIEAMQVHGKNVTHHKSETFIPSILNQKKNQSAGSLLTYHMM